MEKRREFAHSEYILHLPCGIMCEYIYSFKDDVGTISFKRNRTIEAIPLPPTSTDLVPYFKCITENSPFDPTRCEKLITWSFLVPHVNGEKTEHDLFSIPRDEYKDYPAEAQHDANTAFLTFWEIILGKIAFHKANTPKRKPRRSRKRKTDSRVDEKHERKKQFRSVTKKLSENEKRLTDLNEKLDSIFALLKKE